MRSRDILILLILMCCSCYMTGQNKEIDSIRNVLKTEKEDTNKVKTLNYLASSSHTTNPDSSISLALQAEELAAKLGWTIGEANACRNAGLGYSIKGDYPNSLANLLKALKMAEELGNKKLQARMLGSIGIVYSHQGDYPRGLDCYLKALKIDEEMGYKKLEASILSNIGVIYKRQGNYSKGLDYYLQALKMDEGLGDKQGQATDLGNMGIIYFHLGDYPKSIGCYMKALKMDEELGFKQGQAADLGNLGNIYSSQRDYPKALEYHLKALKMDEELRDNAAQAADLGNIGSAYTKTGKFKEAEEYLGKAIALDSSIGEQNDLRQYEELISQLYDTTGRYKLAFVWLKKVMVLKDTLFNIDRNKALTRKEMTFEFEKKQAEAKAEQDKKDFKQKIITWSVITVLLLVVLFAGFIFRSLRITQKQKKFIEKQKLIVEEKSRQVEEKNKDILDSITYAKRLQDAILPPLSMVARFLPNSFVFYKPKDIVAGDFYWMEQVGDFVIVAAADCTGHGVSGAMVSMVCSTALSRTVKEFHITEPGKILDKVRELVLEAFEKSEGNIQDGMDISLIAISHQVSANSFEAQWSGAYNSLWYISGGEVIEVPADKQPIGKVDKPVPFNTHKLNLQKGDVLYLFTDGYADQFGGPKGKKFKYKQFQEKLLAVSHQPLAEQKDILEKKFEEWKGNLEQVDDVLIIGIRL